MLQDIGLFGFLKMTFALILFLGPGYGLLRLYLGRTHDPILSSKTYSLLLAFVLSVSFWAIILAWLYPLNLRLSPVPAVIISLAGWVLGLVQHSRYKSIRSVKHYFLKEPSHVMLVAVLLVIIGVGIWGVRDEVAGAGSDSYHHTLFAQLILQQGKLPEDYQPVTDQVVTFTYHFGYHAVVAILGWLSGVSLLKIVLISGPLWVALSALSVAFLVEILTRSRWGGVIAAIITGLTCIFPTHILNWGRYPQLTGLILLAVWFGLILTRFEIGERGFLSSHNSADSDTANALDWRWIISLSLLSAGIGFAHYRVSLITLTGLLTLLPLFLWTHRGYSLLFLWVRFRNLFLAAVGCFILFSPWVWHVVVSRQQGFPLVVGEFAPVFSQLSRLGTYVLNFPTNSFLLVLAGLAITLGIIRRSRVIFWVLLWSSSVWIFSHPRLASFFMDRISVAIAIYIPLAIAVGWLVAQIEQASVSRRWLGHSLFVVASIGLVVWSTPKYLDNISAGKSYLHRDDLVAADWIRENTPETAYFMVNLFHFPFSADLIVGSDGGYWLPLTTGRSTVSIPMSYMPEKFRTPDGINRLKALDQLNGHLCTPDAIRLLRKEGVTHVYIGSHGGNILPEELLTCAPYVLEYNLNSTYVFRFDSLAPLP